MAENTMIDASEARRLTEAADPNREYSEADTLAQSALSWALRNAEGRTDTRVRTYAQHGHTHLSLKFAPGSGDGRGNGNSFYNDLLGNSNVAVADAICDIIYGRDQQLISPLQSKRLLNTYSTRLARFVRTLGRLGYEVTTGSEEYGNANLDDSTIIVSW